MKACCEQDLQPDDLKAVVGVVEEGDVLDEQVGMAHCSELEVTASK